MQTHTVDAPIQESIAQCALPHPKTHMGKKSKKGNRGNGGGARRPPSSPQSKSAWTAPDTTGRMTERQGRRLYSLLDTLSYIVVPRVNRYLPPGQEIVWNPQGSAYNSMATRTKVYDYLLENAELLSNEIQQGQHEGTLKRALGRRLLPQDLKDIEGLKCHIEDDFFILKHIPNQGTVFCQVGRVSLLDEGKLEYENDRHEVRLFLVQGLADSFQNLCRGVVDVFARRHAKVAEKYSEEFPDLCEIHTTLIPYNNVITYISIMNHPTQNHHTTPQETLAAVKLAVEAYRAAFAVDPPEVYRSLSPETDQHLCRLGSSPANLMTRPIKHSMGAAMKEKDGALEIIVRQVTWSPFNCSNENLLEDIMYNVLPRPPHEGAKNEVAIAISCQPDQVCPFHRSLGDGRKFSDCCLDDYTKRMQKGRVYYLTFDPLRDDESERVEEYQASVGRVIGMTDICRIGYMIFCDSTFQIDPSKSTSFKELMDECPLFQNILEYKWVFLSQAKVKCSNMGLFTFGDIELDPENGRVMMSTSTEGRLQLLSSIMKGIVAELGIHILAVDIKVTPVQGNKPPPSLVDAMRKTLLEGLGNLRESDVSTNVAKTLKAGRACGYCGLRDEDKLQRCACKKIWYCCVSHQKKHWADHKKTCSASPR